MKKKKIKTEYIHRKGETREEGKLKNFWLRLWNLLKTSQKQIKVIFWFTIVYEGIRMIGPYVLKFIIDALTEFKPEDIGHILLLILLLLTSEQVVALLGNFKARKVLKTLIGVECYLPVNIHKKLVGLSLSYHVKENTGNKITSQRQTRRP